jgi:pimeloyl-ACP methyl ester carboxylesterase
MRISGLKYVIPALAAAGLLCSCGPRPTPRVTLSTPEASARPPVGVTEPADGTQRIAFTGNWWVDTHTASTLDGVWSEMGNVNEIVDTAHRIRPTSELSAFREWKKTADWETSLAEQSLAAGHRISAGEEYLRAASYYLAGEIYLHTNPDDPRILEIYKKAGDLFLKGLLLVGEPAELAAIPYEATTLRGYFFHTPLAKGRAPTMIVHEGFDAPVESVKFIADEAIKRGYNCLLFEGPGQGLTIREKKLPFRPDWENVVTPVVNYAVSRSDVDPSRLILMGISMGGGFAARAASYEHRFKVVVLDPGYADVSRIFKDILTDQLFNLYEQDPVAFNDKILHDLAAFDMGARWGLHHGIWVFGARTPADLFTQMRKYDYSRDVPKIASKTVIMDGDAEQYGAGQSKVLYDLLTCPKYLMRFTQEEHAGDHCQVGAPGLAMERLFNWLDENM